jgi:hypothetical protein
VSAFDKELEAVAKSDEWNDFASLENCRLLIGKLFNALLLAEEPLRVSRFEQMTEKTLNEESEKISLELNLGRARALLDSSNAPEIVFDRAVFILRYLETVSIETASLPLDVNGPCCRFPDFYVIPIKEKFNKRKAEKGHHLKRRALLFHRVVPRYIDGLTIEIIPHRQLRTDFESTSRNVGASTFRHFSLVIESSDKSFCACDATCKHQDLKAALESQLITALELSCDTLIWPELTLTDANVQYLVNSLGREHLSTKFPPVVVAGSWHTVVDGGRRNRCTILDGRGELLFFQDKVLPYFVRKEKYGKEEGIQRSDTIRILCTESELIGIFICLDFCHVDRTTLLSRLDLSLAIVPSMGGEATMWGHIQRGSSLSTLTGTKTVVVQQILSDETEEHGPFGYLLRGPGGKGGVSVADLVVEEQFTSFHLD